MAGPDMRNPRSLGLGSKTPVSASLQSSS
jgi:hypothetical protein